MVPFDAAHKAVHYPDDRRFRIWVRPAILIGIAAAIFGAVAVAWIQFAVVGLPYIPPVTQILPNNFSGPHGFPLWVRYCHFLNFLFVMLLIRSGLSILMDHPRLYFNDDCTPGSEYGSIQTRARSSRSMRFWCLWMKRAALDKDVVSFPSPTFSA